jgi:hypothetical protein
MAESTTIHIDEGNRENLKLQLTSNTHKPLHATKSSPAFRSMEYLEVQQAEFEGNRSRSSSAPLSAEAVTVARELRKASDIFLKAKSGAGKKRRRTLASILSPSIEKEVAHAIRECDEYPELPIYEGTPV